MELIEEYIKQIIHVHGGVYHVKCGPDVTMDEMDQLHSYWKDRYGKNTDKTLIITRVDVDINYEDTFDFYIAMKLVREGKRVTRDYSETFYVYLHPVTNIIMEQMLPEEEFKPERFTFDEEDMDGLWKLAGSQDE